MKALSQEQGDRLDQILHVEETNVVDFVAWLSDNIPSHASLVGAAPRAYRAAKLLSIAAEILRDERSETLIPPAVLDFVDSFAAAELQDRLSGGTAWK